MQNRQPQLSQLSQAQIDDIDKEIERLIRPMPPEWENPSTDFQPSIRPPKLMFEFDEQQSTGVFDRLQAWSQDATLKVAVFMALQHQINPKNGDPPIVRGIRIRKASPQHINEFFRANVHPTARARIACLWVDTIVSLEMISLLLDLFPNVMAVRFEPIPRQTHPQEAIHRVHPLVQMCAHACACLFLLIVFLCRMQLTCILQLFKQSFASDLTRLCVSRAYVHHLSAPKQGGAGYVQRYLHPYLDAVEQVAARSAPSKAPAMPAPCAAWH